MHHKAPISLLSFSLLASPVLANPGDAAVCNANHIFNAIHSSMRQWGGSLNHNGMSMFLATVPEGTQLYHGTSDSEFIKGMQWLAFEPEHALIFARPREGPGGPPPHEGEGPSEERLSDGKELGVEGMPHDREGCKHHGSPPEHKHAQPPEYGHGPLPSTPQHDEHHDRPDRRPLHNGKDGEHHRPPSDHEHELPSPPPHGRKPCNGTERRPPPPHHEHEPPPPPDYEHGDHKGRPHLEHGPPPPLPPGHIYKPYPPPPRKGHKEGRPYEGHHRPWNNEWRRPPPPEYFDELSKHHGPPPPEYYADHHDHHNRPPPPNHHDDSPKRHGPLPPKDHDHRDAPVSMELHFKKRQAQQPLKEPPPSDDEKVGYLHTYVPMHPLRLLYIDGLSAGKTSNGTLDTQDRLLLNLTAGDIGGPMGGEMARAKGLCELAATIWKDRVDGILRLEGGFEIILCDFERHLERVDVVSVTTGERGGRRGPMGGWEYIKAITSRYHGIGGNRVHIDYEKFVSVFGYEGVKGLWDNDVQSDTRMPRLTNVSPADLQKIKDDVTALILEKNWNEDKGRDWQAVADMVVARYSSPLRHIAITPVFRKDKEALARYLQSLLRPFVDGTARNATVETSRCVAQMLPSLPSLSIPPASLAPLAHRALHTVTTRICDTLLTSLSIATSPTPHSSFSTVYAEHAVEVVQELVEWLNWTSWKECGTCGDEEVCFVPIWPMGSKEDHARPSCRGEKDVEGRMGYWGRRGMGPPPPGKGKPGKVKEGKKSWW